MNKKEALKLAIDGERVRKKDWTPGEYLSFNGDHFIDESCDKVNPGLLNEDDVWEKFKEPAKLVTWYRAMCWFKNNLAPTFSIWFRSKEEFREYYSSYSYKVIEWEEKKFPATWEECEGVE